jgi:membrane protease YdiL (CAAX protease family)
MARSQPASGSSPKRGLLARPLDTLIFLLPLVLLYEVSALYSTQRVVAFDLTRTFFELFGHVGRWAPAIAVVAILLAMHVVSKDPWRIHWKRIGFMYVKACALAVPLLVINKVVRLLVQDIVPLQAAASGGGLFEELTLSVGAGIYEELVFRLVLISMIVIIGVDIFHLRRSSVAIAAVLLSALAFAVHHHPPIGSDPYNPTNFTFRVAAGVYLAAIFWYRGYGPAAGCHAAYNITIVVMTP